MIQFSAIEKLIFYNLLGVKVPSFLLDDIERSLLDKELSVSSFNSSYGLKDLDLREYDYNMDLVHVLLRYKWVFKYLPFVKQVGVCNSLPLGASDSNSDIDLFFIVDHNRFFIARFFTVAIFQMLGVRRYGDRVSARFCLSFWLSDRELDISDLLIKDDYYFAFWINNLWWLIDDMAIVNEFELENKSFINKNMSTSLFGEKKKKFLERLLSGNFGRKVDLILERYQMKRALRKFKLKNSPKGVVLRRGVFKCHDKDIRWDFRNRFRNLKKTLFSNPS